MNYKDIMLWKDSIESRLQLIEDRINRLTYQTPKQLPIDLQPIESRATYSIKQMESQFDKMVRELQTLAWSLKDSQTNFESSVDNLR